MTDKSPIQHKLLKGKDKTLELREQTKTRAETLRKQGWVPHLASLEIGLNPAAALYIRNQKRVAAKMGIDFQNREFGQDITQREMLAAIRSMNVDPVVCGTRYDDGRGAPSRIACR